MEIELLVAFAGVLVAVVLAVAFKGVRCKMTIGRGPGLEPEPEDPPELAEPPELVAGPMGIPGEAPLEGLFPLEPPALATGPVELPEVVPLLVVEEPPVGDDPPDDDELVVGGTYGTPVAPLSTVGLEVGAALTPLVWGLVELVIVSDPHSQLPKVKISSGPINKYRN